ncbi:MAG: hypothetical protein HY762_01485 [Planctomycetes bacterium]|nr:hypothetical protein [Planctomycetota bacterium]
MDSVNEAPHKCHVIPDSHAASRGTWCDGTDCGLAPQVDTCKECGKRVPGGDSDMSFYCQQLHLCRYCYNAKFPKREMWNLPPVRRFYGRQWIDLRPVASWRGERDFVRESDIQEAEESKELLPEERDE